VSQNNTPKKPVMSDQCLRISARYGMGGHESEYVFQCWDLSEPERYQLMPCPQEITAALEKLMATLQDGTKRWYLIDRGSHVEINLIQGRGPSGKFISDHVTLQALIVKACADVSKALAETQRQKSLGNDHADATTSDYFRENGLFFPPLEVEVGND